MTQPVFFHIGKGTYRFKWHIGFGVFCALFFILCCLLGVWQLHRYHYKKDLLTAYEQRQARPESLQQVMHETSGEKQFRAVTTEGEYLSEFTVLVQNRVYHEQVGFEVFTPLRIAGEKTVVLVDRGWVSKADAAKPVEGKQHVLGYLKANNEYQFILGKNVLSSNNERPIMMQKLDLTDIAKVTGQDFYPFVLRLDPQAQHGFVRDWTISAVSPERHLGYTVQWFIFAFIILIAYFCFCIERVTNANEKK